MKKKIYQRRKWQRRSRTRRVQTVHWDGLSGGESSAIEPDEDAEMQEFIPGI